MTTVGMHIAQSGFINEHRKLLVYLKYPESDYRPKIVVKQH